jgi:diguanylate cyclase (GGDEF)-like protein
MVGYPAARTPRVSLLTAFGVLSALVVAGIGLVVGLVMADSIRSRAVADAARTGEVAANVGVRPFLEVADLQQDFVPLPDERIAAIDASLGSSLSPNGVVRIKVWNRQHWLVYSDNAALRRRWFAGVDPLEQAFAGEITSEITDLSGPEEREERDFGELLAVYVPLRDGGDGRFSSEPDAPVIGAFEIYLPFAPIRADIAADTQRLWIALATGLAVLYLVLFRLVARASRRIERQAAENVELATRDSLTGLVNRDAFLAAVDRRRPEVPGAGASASPGDDVVVLLDLDGFARINDTLGHEVGDELLAEVARRLAGPAGPDDLVARLGGDEFALLLAGVHPDEVMTRLSAFIRAVHEPVDVGGVRLDVHASFGAVAVGEDDDAITVLRRADIAMYAAKADQSVLEFFRPELDDFAAEALALASEVRAGMAGGQFTLNYQPKYALGDGSIVGAEALVRWQHPERGFVSPARFMPTVEALPIGRELTDHILATAIAACATWRAEGLDFGVSVNLSARDVNDPALVDVVESLLAANGVPAEVVTLELTEGSALANEDRTIEILLALRALGCGISIDDFGTGYASITYLAKLPATELKIDQSFVRDIDTEPQAQPIVRHCVALAHSLGFTATAEGVETTEEQAVLESMGCDVGQGYLVSKPLPYDQFVAFVRDRQRMEADRNAASGGGAGPVERTTQEVPA